VEETELHIVCASKFLVYGVKNDNQVTAKWRQLFPRMFVNTIVTEAELYPPLACNYMYRHTAGIEK